VPYLWNSKLRSGVLCDGSHYPHACRGPDACCSAMLVSRTLPDGWPYRAEHEVSRHFGPTLESPPPAGGTSSIFPGPPEIGWKICFTRLPQDMLALSRIGSGLSRLDTSRILNVAQVAYRRIGGGPGAVTEPGSWSRVRALPAKRSRQAAWP
jgi:hypothetical protein